MQICFKLLKKMLLAMDLDGSRQDMVACGVEIRFYPKNQLPR